MGHKLKGISISQFIIIFKILFILRIIILFMYIAMVFIALFMKLNVFFVIAFCLLCFVVVLIVNLFNKIIETKLENLNFEFVNKVYQEIGCSKEKNVRNLYMFYIVFNRAIVHYLQGEFDTALKINSQLKIKSKTLLKQKIKLECAIYSLQNNQDFFNESSLSLQKIKTSEEEQKYIDMLRKLFFEKEICEVIKLRESKLSDIEFNYFSAINYINQQQFEEAKQCFEKIKNERVDLYYVQEAKKYLVELSDN